ncbi:MAG: SDR family oxidoreductase [Chloroflexota bacterium]|nr:SDR family oxidoreductase [Chloroflexota bacterium]
MDKRPDRRLEGKVAIVTGAGVMGGTGVGNGKATAILFAREGAKVVITDVVSEWLEGTREAITAEGGQCAAVVGDVSKPEDCRRAVDTAIERFGALHVLFNNVGIDSHGTVLDVSDEEWRKVIGINLMGMVFMSRYSIPHMKAAGGGSITNVSSVAALRPRGMAPYTVTKAAVIGLTQEMAIDHAKDLIRVNCIMPGLIYSPRMALQVTPEMRERRRRASPLQVEGEPWDIAWAAVYLASDEARWTTGIVLPVDGGRLLTSALSSL